MKKTGVMYLGSRRNNGHVDILEFTMEPSDSLRVGDRVAVSWDVPDEHKCDAMETIREYRIRRDGNVWWLVDGNLATAIVACPFCGEKLP